MLKPETYSFAESAASDTSTVYGLYRDSGKLINLSDWSGAFDVNCRSELDGPDSSSSDDEEGRVEVNGKRKASPSPTKSSSRKRPRANRGRREGGEEGAKAGKRKQVDARFLRAVGDLGYQGLVTATKRRPEHVNRVVW